MSGNDAGAVMIATIQVRVSGMGSSASRTEAVIRLNARPRGLPYEYWLSQRPARLIATTDGPQGSGERRIAAKSIVCSVQLLSLNRVGMPVCAVSPPSATNAAPVT